MQLKNYVAVALTAVLFGTAAEAQSPSVIIRAGVNLANVSYNNDGDIDDANSLTSYQAGIIVDIPAGTVFSIQPGLIYTGKGTKLESGDESGPTYFRSTSNPTYIEMPVNLVFKAPIGGTTRFFAGAGPYLAVGVGGKNKVKGSYLGASFSSEQEIEFSDDDPTTLDYEEGAGMGIMKRFDYGLNGIAGIEGAKTVLSVGYGHGLAKLQSGADDDANDRHKHRVWSFTLGIRL